MTGKAKKIAVAIVAVVIVLVMIFNCFYIINETQQGVLTHFGKIAPPVREPGLHVKWPRPVSKVYKVDRRINVLAGLSQELITEDKKNVLIEGYILWRIVDPMLFVKAIRTTQNATDRLRELYISSSGIVISNEARDSFITLGLEHEDLHDSSNERILAMVAPIAREDYGIEVIRTGVVQYTLPAENRASVIQRMISERARIAARYRSEGEEMALRIEALAVNKHEKVMADAHAEAAAILGDAEAEAMSLLGKAYKEDPEFYKFIRALDSYDLIIDRNTTLMLPADNELFRYLNSKEVPDSGKGR